MHIRASGGIDRGCIVIGGCRPDVSSHVFSRLVDTADVCDERDVEDVGDGGDVVDVGRGRCSVLHVAQPCVSDHVPPLAVTSDAPPPPAASAPAMAGIPGLARAAGAVQTPLSLPLPLHAPLGGRAGDEHGEGMASLGIHDGRSSVGMHDVGSGFGECGALSQVDSDLLWAMRDDDEVGAIAALATGRHPPRS